MNSFTLSPKREPIDETTGEWSGINDAMWRLTGGRTRRVQLHALGDAPHTGCGCFRLIMFTTDQPRSGVAIMDRSYKDTAPDGRTWADLHYALGGKQAPGIAGASAGYLRSDKFLKAHGGWDSVVWVSPGIAEMMTDDLPQDVPVATDA
jgi:acetyl-CoA decarbonylase/synthase complex subunit beta